MNRIALFSLITFLLSCNFEVGATWYQGSAQQQIEGGSLDEIRMITIKKAIANASLQSHSYISTEDVSLDGLLQSSKTIIRSQGDIRRVEVLSESIANDVLTVQVKVDIEPFDNCSRDNHTKKILITQFPLLKPTQASYGGIFNLGSQVSKRFEQQLMSSDNAFSPLLIDKNFLSPNSFQQINKRQASKIAHYLGNEYSSQFVLFGFIRDISLFEQTKEQLIFDDTLQRRNFTFQLYLYDMFKDVMLLQKSYHGEANWQFANNGTVDTYNSVFWRSDYGRVILNTISNAIIDVTDKLKCQRSLAKVIEVNRDQVVINIGAQQGVKADDVFELIKQRTIVHQDGENFSILNEGSQKTFKVMQLGEKITVLTSDSPSLILNTHLYDLVKVKALF